MYIYDYVNKFYKIFLCNRYSRFWLIDVYNYISSWCYFITRCFSAAPMSQALAQHWNSIEPTVALIISRFNTDLLLNSGEHQTLRRCWLRDGLTSQTLVRRFARIGSMQVYSLEHLHFRAYIDMLTFSHLVCTHHFYTCHINWRISLKGWVLKLNWLNYCFCWILCSSV